MSTKLSLSLAMGLGAAAAVLLAGLSTAQADINVATAGPMTGQYAAFGEQMQRGADMAVKDLNAAGGINGEKLRFQVADDACDPKQAVAVANQLARDRVVLVAGHFCSGSSIPASQVYNEEGMLQISPASTNPQLTEQGFDNVFRICGRDDRQGQVAGDFLAQRYKDQDIAIIHDKTAYGKGLADQVKASLNAKGVKEKLYEAFSAGEKDYSALVSRLKQDGIDVLYIGGYHTEAGLITRQLRSQGMNTQVVSGDALVTDEYWKITGPAGEGTLMTFGPDPRKRPEAQGVVERFRQAGYEPEGYTLYTYAAFQVFEQAVKKAGSTDVDDVTEAMRNTDFNTVLGVIGFDDKGDVKTPAYVFYEWKNGSYEEASVQLQ